MDSRLGRRSIPSGLPKAINARFVRSPDRLGSIRLFPLNQQNRSFHRPRRRHAWMESRLQLNRSNNLRPEVPACTDIAIQ